MLGHPLKIPGFTMADTGPTAQNHALLDVPFHGFWLLDVDGNTVFTNATLTQLLGGEISGGTPALDRIATENREDFQAITATLALGVSDEMDLALLDNRGNR